MDGQRFIRDMVQGPVPDARALGVQLAEKLLARGGASILNDIYGKA